LLETKREKVPAERLLLVARKSAPDNLGEWGGKSIATRWQRKERYVVAVALQGKLGTEIRLQSTANVENSVFDLADGSAGAPDAVLLEETAWKLFETDEEIAPKLKVIYRSEELPRNLVVVFRPQPPAWDTGKVADVLKAYEADEAGRAVLGSIWVEEFRSVDEQRLGQARKLFAGE